MTDLDVVPTSEVTTPTTGAFGALNDADAPEGGDNGAAEHGDNKAAAAFYATMRKLGRQEAIGQSSRLDALIAPMDAIFDGSIDFIEKKKGPKKKGAVEPVDHVAVGFEAYRDANAKAGKGMTSPAQQLSKFRAVAKWASGPAAWEVKETRDAALKKHAEIFLANKDAKKDSRQPIFAASQMLINLAHAQMEDARIADPERKDTPLTQEEIDACIYKPARQEKEFVEYLDTVIDKLNARADAVGSEEEGEKLAALCGMATDLRDYLKDLEKQAQEAEENMQAFNLLRSRGFDVPVINVGGVPTLA
jgi:hypothetical protein